MWGGGGAGNSALKTSVVVGLTGNGPASPGGCIRPLFFFFLLKDVSSSTVLRDERLDEQAEW